MHFYEHLTVHRVLICNFHDESSFTSSPFKYTIHLPNGVFINTASFVTLYSKLNISHILFIFSIVSGKSLISFYIILSLYFNICFPMKPIPIIFTIAYLTHFISLKNHVLTRFNQCTVGISTISVMYLMSSWI